MSYLLDTCVISEVTRRVPSEVVTDWLSRQSEETLFLSVITLGEIERGVSKLLSGPKRVKLKRWLDQDLLQRFQRRLLPVDHRVARAWGAVQAELEVAGTPMPAIDGLLSATARTHGLILVTRNTSNFKDPVVELLNPWD